MLYKLGEVEDGQNAGQARHASQVAIPVGDGEGRGRGASTVGASTVLIKAGAPFYGERRLVTFHHLHTHIQVMSLHDILPAARQRGS